MKSRMSAKNRGCTDWFLYDDWVYWDKERNLPFLKAGAPEAARRSFEQYKQVNRKFYDEEYRRSID